MLRPTGTKPPDTDATPQLGMESHTNGEHTQVGGTTVRLESPRQVQARTMATHWNALTPSAMAFRWFTNGLLRSFMPFT